MASGTSESNGRNAVAWELSKENVKPVKSGRNVSCIQAVLEPSEEDAERLMMEKQRFEEDIIAEEHSEDPIAPWHRYLEWTIQNFPSGRNTKILTDLLSKFIGKFKSGQYNNDTRYVNAWLKLAEIMNDPLEIYSFMNTEGIGQFQAEFYIAWADEYEKYGDTKKANRIYTDGMTKDASPADLLQKRHVEFQLRIARGILRSDSQESDGNERIAFNQLESRKKHGAVGSMRVGTAFKPLANQRQMTGSKLAASQTESLQIYEDNFDPVTVMGQQGKWAGMPSKSSSKENDIDPSKWNTGVEFKRKTHRHQVTLDQSQANFEIYEDESERVPEMQHRTVAKSVLAEKKDALSDFSQIKSALNEMPMHDKNSKSFYDIDKVYTVMGEMQFEEVRAAFWRKKQRIIAEQKQHLEERRLEAQLWNIKQAQIEEKRMFVQQRMELMEMEKRVMETERMKMKKHKLDLENRLREIKTLEKTALTWEEAENLHREEEDITVQLGAVERKLRSENFKCTSEPSENNPGQCVDENIQLAGTNRQITSFNQNLTNLNNEEVQAITSGIQKDVASGNNSLNHSRRSQPSPTVNTKEAMTHISAWFQKSLEDDEFLDNSVCRNSKCETLKHEVGDYGKKSNVVDENAAPFEIFVENPDDISSLPKILKPKKGLTSRSFHSDSENDAVSSTESKDFTIHVDDKTNSVFDDVTVAGSHFAAKARMASTPALSKTNVFQDSQHIGNLSCIPSYQGMETTTTVAECSEEPQQSHYENENSPHTDEAYVDEVKQLTPIMEDSKESEKSSVSTLKSSSGQSAPSFVVKQTISTSSYSQMNSTATSASLKSTSGGQHSDANESSDSLDDFSFWGVKLTDTKGSDTESNNNYKSKTTHEEKECVEAFQQEECIESITGDQNHVVNNLSTSNITHDPWDNNVVSSILQKTDRLALQSDVSIVHNESVLPITLKPGAFIELSEKFKIGKVIGEGAYAKVFELSNSALVLKAQFPPCPWEVYATTVAKSRLLSQGMYDAADAIVNINSGFFYDDCSLLLLPRFRKGTLLHAINTKRKAMVLKDAVAVWAALEIMKVVNCLHTVGIIHGDIKPDNFMIVPNTDGEYSNSIKLIDFGRAIDMTQMPKYAMFMKDCGTSGFSCIQMKQNQPWNYHIDYYGIAGTLYVVLFGAYMNVKKSDDGLWRITGKLKRWHDGPLWEEFFKVLINHPTPSNKRPVTIEDSPLPKLLEKFEEKIRNMGDAYSAVDTFFKGL